MIPSGCKVVSYVRISHVTSHTSHNSPWNLLILCPNAMLRLLVSSRPTLDVPVQCILLDAGTSLWSRGMIAELGCCSVLRRTVQNEVACYAILPDGSNGCRVAFAALEYALGESGVRLDGALFVS